jgi:hypothetical protein
MVWIKNNSIIYDQFQINRQGVENSTISNKNQIFYKNERNNLNRSKTKSEEKKDGNL